MKSKKEKPKAPKNSTKSKADKKGDGVSKPDGFDFGGIPDRDLKKNLGCG